MTSWGKRGSEPLFPPILQARPALPHDLPSPRGLMEAGRPGLGQSMGAGRRQVLPRRDAARPRLDNGRPTPAARRSSCLSSL
jgi:hypothetical protein